MKRPERPILIVDDDPQLLSALRALLASNGVNNVVCIEDSRQALPCVETTEPELVFLDVNMPHVSGLDLLRALSEQRPSLPVYMLSGMGDVTTAIECMKLNARDYFVKPVEGEKFAAVVRQALKMNSLQQENERLRSSLVNDELENPEAFAKIVTSSRKMRSLFQYMTSIAKTPFPVLIEGETGVGKELFAEALHTLSGRTGRSTVVNVASLDDAVFSDALFGHLKGAFTGADGARQGLLEVSGEGTVFLDEIGDLSPASQMKLLRLIEYGEYYPLGADRPRHSSARVVMATHRNLKDLVEQGSFRKDLYYRLNTHVVSVPPLRERREDLPLLLDHFFEEAATIFGKKAPYWPPELLSLLALHPFPGNVRELRGMVQEATANHRKGVLSLEVFRRFVGDLAPDAAERMEGKTNPVTASLVELYLSLERLPSLKGVEDACIEAAMIRCNQNQSLAAKMLGISRTTLNGRLKQAN